ncbi:aromatic-ring hydroxylase C-terminal domain-containing protein [Streptomyces erythrochromogenes]|uniref:aromatic-ring hydroxylase C-terminal domain-containing protein n=1 Tax=Streptomyces erythrochromogenes TaxID=285574 RepID=UPI003825A051
MLLPCGQKSASAAVPGTAVGCAHVPRRPDALLDTYHDERHPVGADLLASTRAQTALMTGHSPEGQALRARLSGLIADLPELSRTLAERLSALSVAYPAGEDDHRLAGTRAPDLRLGGTGLFALLRTGHHVLLDLSGGTPPAEGVTHHRGPLSVPHADRAGVAASLIRPDGHVAWADDAPDADPRAAVAGRWG